MNRFLGQPATPVKTSNPFLAPPAPKVATYTPPKTNIINETNKFLQLLPSSTADVGNFILDFAKHAAQGTISTGIATGLSLLKFNQDHPIAPVLNKLMPPGTDLSEVDIPQALQFATGTPKVEELGKSALGLSDEIKQNSFAKKYGLDKFSLPLAIGATSIDAGINMTPFGGEGNVAKQLAKETGVEAVAKILQKINVNPDLIATFAKKFALTSDINEVRQGLKVMNAAQALSKAETISKKPAADIIREAEAAYSKFKPRIVEPIAAPAEKIAPNLKTVVEPPSVRGGVTSPKLDLYGFKDRPTALLARETLERNIEKVASPEDAAKLKEFLPAKIAENEAARVTFVNSVKKDALDAAERLGIKPGSKDDQLIQKFGEGLISQTDLIKESPKNWKNIIEASKYFRKTYDILLDKINSVRTQFGYQPVTKRENYFRHFRDIEGVVSQLGILFKDSDLPTDIAGITDTFKPGRPFTTVDFQRQGTKTAYSAFRGLESWLDSASKQIFHTESVQRVRAVEKYIRQTAKTAGTYHLGPDTPQLRLPAFVANLNEYGNLLAGKAARLDRAVESTIGRRVYKAFTILKNQTGRSIIMGNISSALTNFIPFTESLATTRKVPAIRGLLDTLISQDPREINGVVSEFLTRRYPDGKLAPKFMQKVDQKIGGLFQAIDSFTAHSVVAGKYFEGVARGLSPKEAMKAADNYGARVVTDRSWGQLPNLFQSKTAGALLQFQTEVNNQASFIMHDLKKLSKDEKKSFISAVSQFMLYSYLFNDAYETVTGRRPTIDPIYAGLTLLGQTKDSDHMPWEKRTVTAGKDIAQNIPFGNLIPGLSEGGRFPIASFFPNISKLSQGHLTELLRPVSLQLKKTVEGLSEFNAGKEMSASGKTTRFKIKQNLPNLFRGAVFGPSSFPESQAYYRNLDNPKPKTKKPAAGNRFLR